MSDTFLIHLFVGMTVLAAVLVIELAYWRRRG